MSENREVTLADFQACSGIDDVGEAIMHLENSNWDLVSALNSVMHHDTQQLPSEISPDVEMMEVVQGVPVITFSSAAEAAKKEKSQEKPAESNAKPSTSTSRNSIPRILTFNIKYLDRNVRIDISDTCTLNDLKDAIYEKTSVAPCQQELDGWKNDKPRRNNTKLSSLNLPLENKLTLTPIVDIGDSNSDTITLSDRLTQTYTLNIRDEENNKTYNLKYPGTSTILDVKTGIYSLIDLPVRNQQWKGWPSSAKDDKMTLAQSGITFPEHDFSVSKMPSKEKPKIVDLVDSDSSAEENDDCEEYEDAPGSFLIEDDLFVDNTTPSKFQRLMPDNVENETIGTLHFAEQFEKRYGPAHPKFFTGTFDEAIKESCLKPAKERKLLAVYLHHDNSVLANVFCTQLLGSEAVLQLLAANFVVWGWDFTHESNMQKFISSVTQSLGLIGSEAVRKIHIDTLPVLMILMRSRSTTEIFTIVNGNVGVNELLISLIHAVDVFQDQKYADIGAEEQRQAREKVKEEQDKAYQESLAADRAKEEAKLLQQQKEKEQREQAENERLAEEARKEAHRLSVESSLPAEPEEPCEDVLKIRFRIPGGKWLERRFLPDTKLQILLNYLIVEGYPTEDYKVLCSWPRRDLTSMDVQQTLKQLKFCPQETLYLEER